MEGRGAARQIPGCSIRGSGSIGRWSLEGPIFELFRMGRDLIARGKTAGPSSARRLLRAGVPGGPISFRVVGQPPLEIPSQGLLPSNRLTNCSLPFSGTSARNRQRDRLETP